MALAADARPATLGRSLAHLLGRLAVVDLTVRAAVEARRQVDPGLEDPFRGLYLGDEDIDRLLSGAIPALAPAAEAGPARAKVEAAADADEAAGADLRLRSVSRRFGLDALDEDLLLVAVAPDVDHRCERLYGYLHDDVTRRRASIGLALELTGQHPADAAARDRLGPRGRLVTAGLVEVDDGDRPFLTRPLRVPDRVVAHLLGSDEPEPVVADLLTDTVTVARHAADPGADDPRAGDGDRLARLLAPTDHPGGAGPDILAYVAEEPGASGRSFVVSALTERGRPALVADLGRISPDTHAQVLAALARALTREARLRGAVLVAGPIDHLSERTADIVRLLAEADGQIVLTGRRHWEPGWSRRVPVEVTAPAPRAAERALVWQAHLDGLMADGLDAAVATAQFRLSPEQVAEAAAAAVNQARLAGTAVDAAGLRRGARTRNSAGLERRARRIEPAVGWDDLVLPPAALDGLTDLALRVRHRDQVLTEWSMRPGGGRGRGVTALFAGDSGTGKTMSAEVIAGHLGLDLYVIDLATVVDKYVGETEKNLERVFGEADGVNGVLLFDEADAIFGKRSEVRDAHDRYANIEVAYLLQRMETFDGLAILTTNLRANLDDAFTRRLDAIIDFPVPDEEQRRILWERCLGRAMPRADDVDLDFCAAQFELAGGHIRSIALTAAYLAAGRASPVRMTDLVAAIQREYRKLGRLVVRAEFGDWLDLAPPL
ncbi:MAG TPA: AAA family ATPase [Acidimicrobiales bacterium]|nr:AAA family ATPase [Acidimicrobiales bacterium]